MNAREVAISHGRLEDWCPSTSPKVPVFVPQCILLKIILLMMLFCNQHLRKSELLEAHYESVVKVLGVESLAIS